MGAQIRLLLELLHVVAVRAGVQPPVDVLDVVARTVPARLGEFGGEAPVGGAVEPHEEAFDHGARTNLKASQRREVLRAEQLGAGTLLVRGGRVHRAARSYAGNVSPAIAIGSSAAGVLTGGAGPGPDPERELVMVRSTANARV